MMRITPYNRQLHRIVQHIQRTNHVLHDILVGQHQYRLSSTLPTPPAAARLSSSQPISAFRISQQARALFSIARFASSDDNKPGQKDAADKKPDTASADKPASDKQQQKQQQQQQSSQNQDDDDDEDKKRERMISVFTKAVLWMATIYGMSLVLALMLPQKNRPETTTRWVFVRRIGLFTLPNKF